mgnify:CR=1 FL=1
MERHDLPNINGLLFVLKGYFGTSGTGNIALDQIGKAVSEMERVTQTNAANAEESAAAAEELNAQAESTLVTVAHIGSLMCQTSAPSTAPADTSADMPVLSRISTSGIATLRKPTAMPLMTQVAGPVLAAVTISNTGFDEV